MRLASVAAAALLGLASTGCGGDGQPVAAPPGSASRPAEVTSDAPSVSASPSAAPSGSAASAPATQAVRLTGDGVDLSDGVLVFGTPYADAATALQRALGAPTKDIGAVDPVGGYGSCPGSSLQVLEYGGGALQLLFGDVGAAAPVLHTWALTDVGDPASVPQASAFVGDVTTVAFGVGTTVGALQEQVGKPGFQITEDALSLDPAFTVQDQSGGLRGFLSGASEGDRVTFVEAGAGCGS